jgi:hypothetical protein
LSEQLPIHDPRLARGLEPELLVERAGEVVVAAGDRLAQSERVVGLEGEAPGCLVELVEGDGLLGEFEVAARGRTPRGLYICWVRGG